MLRSCVSFFCAIVVFVLFGVLAATAQQVSGISVPEGLEPLGEEFEPIDIVQEENSASVIRKGPAPAITRYRYYNVYKAADTGEIVVATRTIGYGSKTVVVDGVVATPFKSDGLLDSANVAYGFIDYYRTGRMPSAFNKAKQSTNDRTFYIKGTAVSVNGTLWSFTEEKTFNPDKLGVVHQ